MAGSFLGSRARAKTGELENAFAVFSEASGELIASYRLLEERVASLSKELSAAKDERLRQLAEKERLANRLTLLLESLPGGVVVLDANGHVQECNPAARDLLGEELHGSLWRNVVQRIFAPRPDDGHDMSLSNGRRVSIATCSLGKEPGQILLIKDVTETRRLQDQLGQLRRLSAMGEMAASLAHQIRTPLASALLHAGNLIRTDLEQDARQRFGGKLRAVLGHLEKLVKDMLAFARKGDFQVEAVSMSGLEAGMREVMEAGAGKKPIRYELDNQAGGAVVQGNRDALLSALQNLVENAVQAVQADGRISVHLATTQRGTVQLRVCDDGPGIAADVRERMFEPFFTTRSTGTGLGLSVVQAVVQSHGGTLSVESSVGRGSVFTIELPTQETA